MMKYINNKIWLLLIICLAGTKFSYAQSFDYKNLSEHPRLLLNKGVEEKIKKSLSINPELVKVHKRILSYSDEIMALPAVERIMEGKRLLTISRLALKRIFYLSYTYRMTGEKKYALRAEKEMLAVSAFKDWNPTHFLDVGEMTMALAIGYDWLFQELKQETKLKIRTAILEKGFQPSEDSKFAWFYKSDNNWNQVCNSGLVFGALAVFEDEREFATKIIEKSIATIPLGLKGYAPDGAYPEGYSYWGYGTGFQVLYLAALESSFGTDNGLSKAPGFLESARYMQFMTGPSGLAFNYSDAGKEGVANPVMYWFAAKTGDNSLLWVEKEYLAKGKMNFAEDRLLPMLLISSVGLNMKDIKAPKSFVWAGKGKTPVVLVRKIWDNNKGMYLGAKGGSAKTSHAHMDAGSFVFDANGVRWAMDLGMQDYYSLEKEGVNLWNSTQNSQRWDVFRLNNFVHNTLTVNGEKQKVDAYAPLIEVNSDKDKTGGIFDLSKIYEGDLLKAIREINIIDNKFLLVSDHIKAENKKTTVRWSMTTSATYKVINDSTIELTQAGEKLNLIVNSPKKVVFSSVDNVPPNKYDQLNPGTIRVGFDVVLEPGEEIDLKVRLVPLTK